jgi:hypothetical protein
VNFEYWYNNLKWGLGKEIGKPMAELAWDACKQEVLKILKDKKYKIVYSSYSGDGFEHLDPSVVDEIEKL